MSEEKMQKNLDEWLEGRPQIIKDTAEKLKPWIKYRVKETGQHCRLNSYFEDGTVSVVILGHDSEFLDTINQIFETCVFGFKPEDLEPLAA